MGEQREFRKVRCAYCGGYFSEKDLDYIDCVYQEPIKNCPFAPTVSLPLCFKCVDKKERKEIRREIYFYRSCRYK